MAPEKSGTGLKWHWRYDTGRYGKGKIGSRRNGTGIKMAPKKKTAPGEKNGTDLKWH